MAGLWCADPKHPVTMQGRDTVFRNESQVAAHRESKLWLNLAFAFTLLSLILWIYQVAPTFDFVNLDDHLLIFQDQNVRHLDWIGVWSVPSAGLYHPITTLSFIAENFIFGLNPRAFHINNVLLHMINTLLVFTIVKKISRKDLAVWISASFACHPLAVESVAWVAERKDVLSTLLFLLSCQTYLESQTQRKKILFLVLTGILMTLAMLSKPSAVVLPCIYILLDRTQGPDFKKEMFFEKLPYFMVSACIIAVTFCVQKDIRGMPTWLSPSEIASQTIQSLCFYLAKYLVPTRLSVSYPNNDHLLATWQWAVSAMWLLALMWLISDHRYRKKALVAGSWFLITLTPTLKLIPFGDLSPVNDRFLYIPGLGLSALFFLTVQKIASYLRPAKISPLMLWGTLGSMAVSWSILAKDRTTAWQSTESLWQNVLATYPDDGRAHANLARYYQSIGRAEVALNHFVRAISLKGDKLAALYADLAYLKIEQNLASEAKDLLTQASIEDPLDPRVLNIEGVYLWRQGDLPGAETKLRAALARPPGLSAAEQRAKIMNNLGLVMGAQGDYDNAIAMYQSALNLQPHEASTIYNLGLIYLNKNQPKIAAQKFSEAIARDPSLAEAWADLGVTSYMEGDLANATSYFQKALELNPRHDRARRNLSMVLAKQGRCAEGKQLLRESGSDTGESSWPPEIAACEASQTIK
jgi:Tfp pilus assembly protein PilF